MAAVRETGLTFIALLLLFGGGCGTSCKEIRGLRADFDNRTAGKASPHAAVGVPWDLANSLVARQLGQQEPVTTKIPGLSQLGVSLSASFTLRSVRLVEEDDGWIGMIAAVDTAVDGADVGSLDVTARVAPRLDQATNKLLIPLRAGDLRSVRPKVNSAQKKRLHDLAIRKLPVAARPFATRLLDGALDGASDWLAEAGWESIRSRVLQPLGKLRTFAIPLPDLPLRQANVRSLSTGLLVELDTTLPVRGALPAVSSMGGEGVSVWVAPSTAAELVNVAMDRGEVPSRYRRSGKPDPNGEFEARVAWQRGDRPMRAHLWKVGPQANGECIYSVIAGDIDARLEGDAINVRVDDGVIARVRGPALLEAGAWLARLWTDTLATSMKVSRAAVFRLGAVTYRARVSTVDVGDAAIHAVLALESP